MCGIAGVFSGQSVASDARGSFQAMLRALTHRGPDADGSWEEEFHGVLLGHRRLSILDLSPSGAQPMASASGRFTTTFNGEIYNYKEIQHELLQHGVRFRGTSDTEVMLNAFEKFGFESTLSRMNGMFAMAVWDDKEKILYLARDRFGEKPLYYGYVDKKLVFASELKAITRFEARPLELDTEALATYLRLGYVSGPDSIYKNVYKLPPATFLAVKGEDVQKQSDLSSKIRFYWNPRTLLEEKRTNPYRGSFAEALTELRGLLDDSVRLRMVADVPVGAFLSGGIDSTLVVASMQKQNSKPIRTFSIGFKEERMNEAPFAEAIARHLGTQHTEYYLSDKESLDLVPRLSSLYDEPFADSSQIPTFFVSRLARQQVTVSLSGDGGDEIFGGYPRYQKIDAFWRWSGNLPAASRTPIASALGLLKQIPISHRGKSTSIRGTMTRIEQLSKLFKSKTAYDAYWQLLSQWETNSRSAFAPYWNEASDLGVMASMLYTDQNVFLPEDILAKVDRAAMAVSLETRVPLLDPRIVQLAWRLPDAYRVGVEGKRLLKELLYATIPRNLVDRPKRGFAIPLDEWLRGGLRDWAESLLSEAALQQSGALDVPLIRQKWREHVSGRRRWEQPLWIVLMFQAWNAERMQQAYSRAA